jgi:hypothetical protein
LKHIQKLRPLFLLGSIRFAAIVAKQRFGRLLFNAAVFRFPIVHCGLAIAGNALVRKQPALSEIGTDARLFSKLASEVAPVTRTTAE